MTHKVRSPSRKSGVAFTLGILGIFFVKLTFTDEVNPRKACGCDLKAIKLAPSVRGKRESHLVPEEFSFIIDMFS